MHLFCFAQPIANLFAGEKTESQRGGGDDRNTLYISLYVRDFGLNYYGNPLPCLSKIRKFPCILLLECGLRSNGRGPGLGFYRGTRALRNQIWRR